MLMGLAMALSFSACQQEELANEAEATGIMSRSTDDKYIVNIDTNEAGAGNLEALLTAQAETDGKSVALIDWLFVEGPINANDLTYIASQRYLDSLNIENTRVMTYVYDWWEDSYGDEVETTTLPEFNNIQSKMGIALPKGITIIQNMNEGNFRYVNIPEGVTSIGTSYGFRNCQQLTSFYMPNSVTRLQGSLFYGCTALKSVRLSENLDFLEESVFNGCTSLTTIHLPGKITSIRYSAFQNCSSLAEINIPSNLTEIGYRAFENCSKLGSITLPSTLKTIGYGAFSGCSQLTTQLPNGLETIGDEAFRGCSSITSLTIPESVTSIGTYAFAGTGISTIVMGEQTPIVTGMFAECTNLKTIKIPETGTIPSEFLSGCTSLETVEIPAKTVGIEASAFRGCSSLKEIILPNLFLREIGEYAFANTGISTLTVPSTVKECGTNIVDECSNLSSVFWNSDANVPSLLSSPYSNVLVYVNSSQAAVDTSNPNVIINGVAENITLYSETPVNYWWEESRTLKSSFHCPQAFTAKKATYVRDFSDMAFGRSGQTTPGESNRWQSIVLPFKPTSFKAKEVSLYDDNYNNAGFTKVLAPFDADVPDAKPFWLRELTASGYVDVTALEADKPYIISMPYSDAYLPEYNINSEVEFSAENVTFEVTGELQPSAGPSYSLTPTYSWMEQQEEYLSINQDRYEYATNNYYAPGSVFVSDRDIHPFEAYIYQPGTRSAISISSGNASTRSAGSLGQVPKKEDAGY